MRLLLLAASAWLTADIVSAQVAGSIIASEGSWDLKKAANSTTSTPSCTLTPKQQSRIQIDKDRLVVSALPKNSIFNYQYRVDDKPASTPVVPTQTMQSDGAIYIEGAVFDEIMSGKRFRIRILDRWHEAVTEDVDLTGLGKLHEEMIEKCK